MYYDALNEEGLAQALETEIRRAEGDRFSVDNIEVAFKMKRDFFVFEQSIAQIGTLPPVLAAHIVFYVSELKRIREANDILFQTPGARYPKVNAEPTLHKLQYLSQLGVKLAHALSIYIETKNVPSIEFLLHIPHPTYLQNPSLQRRRHAHTEPLARTEVDRLSDDLVVAFL